MIRYFPRGDETYLDNESGQFKIIHHYTDQKIDKHNRFLYNERNIPIKMFSRSIRSELINELTDVELGRLMKLIIYIGEDNILKKRNSDGMISLTKEDIGSILDLKDRATREYLNKLCEKNIIRKIKYCGEESYVVNPIYFLRGKWMSECTSYSFKEDVERTIANSNEKELFKRYVRKIKNRPEIKI